MRWEFEESLKWPATFSLRALQVSLWESSSQPICAESNTCIAL